VRHAKCLSSILLLVALGLGGCKRAALHRAKATELNQIADQYVRLVVALGERDPDSVDFTVVPEAVRTEIHTAYPSLETIGRQAEELEKQIQQLQLRDDASRQRAAFLHGQLVAIGTRVSMLRGHTYAFDEEARLLFATSRLPDDGSLQRKAIRDEVLRLLPPEKQQSETPAQRYALYDRTFLIPPGRLKQVMTAALAVCRERTRAHLSLPTNETVELTFVRNQPWSAFSRYRGNAHSTIQVNLDLPVTVDEALELACHEGYPGHHVFNTLRDVALAQGNGWPEANVQPTFSPQSYVSEAAAAYAPRLAFSDTEREAVERDVLFPLAGLRANQAERYVQVCNLIRRLQSAESAVAAAYLDGSLEFVRAEEDLAHEVLMDHAEATLLYLNEYRSYVLAYTDGPVRVAEWMVQAGDQAPAEPAGTPEGDREPDRWRRYRMLTAQETPGMLDSLAKSAATGSTR
jgi:hypothetical protein